MQHHDIQLYRGDDFVLKVAVKTANNQPADLTGADCRLGFSDGNSLYYAQLHVIDNVIIAHFSHQLTKDLTIGRALWDLQITKDNIVTTIAKGKLNITQDITP